MKALNISFLVTVFILSNAALWSQEGPPDPILLDPVPPALPEPTLPVPMPAEPDLPTESQAPQHPSAKVKAPERANKKPEALKTEIAAPFWECQLPSGSFLVRISDIVTVSHHAYVLDQSVRIVETNVSTRNNMVARFYHEERFAQETYETGAMLEPLVEGRLALQRAEALISTGAHLRKETAPDHGLPNKPSQSASETPQIDFRLKDKADVLAIHQSARAAWKEEAGGLFQLSQ